MEIINMVKANNNIAAMLKKSYEKGRLSHAYLFNGESGTGKKELAYYLACMLYCKSDEAPCLKCDECISILNNLHLNVILIEKSGQGIKKEQIVALQEEFSKTSLVDGPRIYIIDGIENISSQAANSLLKFIEEPVNSQTYCLLLSEDINSVLPTIISRCAIINFKAIEKQSLTTLLIKEMIDEKLATIIPYLTNSYDEGIELSKDKNVDRLIGLAERFLDIKDSKDAVLFLKENNDYLENTDNLKRMLMILVLIYEDLMKLSCNNDTIVLRWLSEKLENHLKRLGKKKITDDLEIILKYNSRLDFNVSAKNIIHQLMINLY